MKSIRLLLPFLLLPALLSAQKFTLRGTLSDTSAQPLVGATVMLLSPKDSSLLSFTRSDVNGSWDFKNLGTGDYLLRATYFGYRNFQQNVHLEGAQTLMDLGKINMEIRSNLLNEVEIKGEANPVTIKNDTIEFNAGSFKTKDNAVVEDLLKKLPGVEVAQDGTITAQGKEVQHVTVEGKKFFGDDPKVATRNLPADAVKKVQMFDQKSEQATFSGIDDGVREKTINLNLKDEKKKGWFGKIIGGAGADKDNDLRYQGRTTLNSFKPKRQISILGMGNNVNEAGFSIDDYMAFSGAMRSMMGGGGGRVSLQFNSNDNAVPLDFGNNDGYINTYAGGLNFNQEYGKKSNFNGSYFYSRSDKNNDGATIRNSTLQNGSFTTNDHTIQENITDNHRLNFTLDQRIDSFNNVQITSNFVYTQNEQQSQSNAQTFGSSGNLLNESTRDYYSDANASKWTGNALWRHKFGNKKGRNFTLNFNAGLNDNQSTSNSNAPNRLYDKSGQLLQADTIAQDQDFKNNVVDLGAKASYTEPLGNKQYLEFSYGYSQTTNSADKNVYDTNNGEWDFNSLLSNAYDNTYGYHRGGVGYRINRKSWTLGTGVDYQYAILDGKVTKGQGAPVRQTFQNLLPRLNSHFEFGNNRNLDVNYSSAINAPTVSELQPVPDVSDPLNITEGNPDLKPEYAHNMNLNFVSFNPENFRSIFGGIFATYTQDKIVMAQSVDTLSFVRRYRPINTDHALSLNANIALGARVKKWDSRFRLHLNGSVNKGEGMINEDLNKTTTTSVGPSLSWDFDPADWFNFNAEARYNWNHSRYSISSNFDQSYFTQTYNSEVNVQFLKTFNFNSGLDLTVNQGLTAGYNKPIPIWNATLSKFLLKGKKLEVALTVHDILNRNIGISRTANLNYVEDRRVASLGRYAMLRLTYSLNSLAGPGGPGGGPRMRMFIRH